MNRRARVGVGAAVAVVAAAALLTSPGAALGWLAWLAGDPVRFGGALAALSVARPLLGWPTTLLAVAAGAGYGLAGAPFALALVVCSSLPAYALAGRLAGEGRVADAAARFRRETGDVRAVTASRLFPLPSDVVSAAAGLAGVPLAPFLAGTAVGEVPWVLAGTLAGASLDSLAGGPPSLATVADPRLVVAAALVGALVVARPAYRLLATGER